MCPDRRYDGQSERESDRVGVRDMVDAIDKALYKAKDNGRDRVELADA